MTNLTSVALAVITLSGVVNVSFATALDNTKGTCATPEYRQFDFWLGNWDVYEFDGPDRVVAHANVRKILHGCAIMEDFKNSSGPEGMSFSAYDEHRKVWQQSWVSDRPQVLVIEGSAESNAMTLSGREAIDGGRSRLIRGVWRKVEGGVRETAVTSLDDGKSWDPWFDLIFKPHAGR